MDNAFITLLNLSITASYIILAVLLLKLFLFKAPKWISCLLWSVVGIRLILPFSVESVLSLIPSAQPIPENITTSPKPEISSGVYFVNSVVNPIISESFKGDAAESANPLQIVFFIASVIWVIGLALMLLWGVLSYIVIKKKTVPSLKLDGNIYLCDNVSSPFILGIIKPRIYLPSAISGEDAALVTEHERAHIARLDHIWKPLGFIILALYWFNPLVWIAYILLCRDIEKACDQKVIRSMSDDSRRKYSHTLLSYSENSIRISACPLAFGEVGVKTRVKSILNYKKPAFWIIIVAILLLIGTVVAFLTYPKSVPDSPTIPPAGEIGSNTDTTPKYGETDPDKLTYEQKALMEKHPDFFGLDCSGGLDIYVCQFASSSYHLSLFEPSAATSQALYEADYVNIYEMSSILETYDIPQRKVNIIYWQNMFSSYIGQYYMHSSEGELSFQEPFIYNLKRMLFDNEYAYMYAYYDTYIYDIDSDGELEICALGLGRTSGLFSFTISAREMYDEEPEYVNSKVTTDMINPHFVPTGDGLMVYGQTDDGKWYVYDVRFEHGNIELYKKE